MGLQRHLSQLLQLGRHHLEVLWGQWIQKDQHHLRFQMLLLHQHFR